MAFLCLLAVIASLQQRQVPPVTNQIQQQWHTRYFSDAAQLIGGAWLGFGMSLAAMVTNISILNATVLTSSRMPFAMAEDGYLPPVLTAKTSALWHAMDCNSGVIGGVRIVGLRDAHAASRRR